MNKKTAIRLFLIAILLSAAIISVMTGLKSNETITQQEITIKIMTAKICKDYNYNPITITDQNKNQIKIQCQILKE